MSEPRKSLQIQKTYEALYALEDLREIFRQSLPTGFDDKQQEEFSDAITRIKGIIADLEKGEGKPACNQVGRLDPRTREEEHTLTKVDTTGSFDLVAKTHKRRGYFFSDELKDRGIAGEFAGATRTWKLNTYGLTWEQIEYAAESFLDIASKHGLNISEG